MIALAVTAAFTAGIVVGLVIAVIAADEDRRQRRTYREET